MDTHGDVMLKLSRRNGERVRVTIPGVGFGIVSIEKVSNNNVMLGFDFPRQIGIHLDKQPRPVENSSAQDRATLDARNIFLCDRQAIVVHEQRIHRLRPEPLP